MAHDEIKVAIVTGGSGGIGQAICGRLAAEGFAVIAIGRNATSLQCLHDRISSDGGRCDFLVMDVRNREETRRMADGIISRYGRIDVLVNNAGTDIKGSISEFPEESWDLIIDLNLKGTFLCTQAVSTQMMQQRYGRIINISSMAGKTGEPFTAPYCASKFGIVGFTQAVAAELGAYNVTVNAVCPGPVETELITKSVTQSAALNGRSFQEEMNEKFLKLTPMGRIATPNDVAGAVWFLASDDAGFITGIALDVSGGREMH